VPERGTGKELGGKLLLPCARNFWKTQGKVVRGNSAKNKGVNEEGVGWGKRKPIGVTIPLTQKPGKEVKIKTAITVTKGEKRSGGGGPERGSDVERVSETPGGGKSSFRLI